MITVPTINNRILESTTEGNDYFSETFTFAELKEAGFMFKAINDKGKGKFIVAKIADDVVTIPCGKSVTDEHTTQECSFGLSAEDGNLIAYVTSGDWI